MSVRKLTEVSSRKKNASAHTTSPYLFSDIPLTYLEWPNLTKSEPASKTNDEQQLETSKCTQITFSFLLEITEIVLNLSTERPSESQNNSLYITHWLQFQKLKSFHSAGIIFKDFES